MVHPVRFCNNQHVRQSFRMQRVALNSYLGTKYSTLAQFATYLRSRIIVRLFVRGVGKYRSCMCALFQVYDIMVMCWQWDFWYILFATRVPYHQVNALYPWCRNTIVILYTETQREIFPDETWTRTPAFQGFPPPPHDYYYSWFISGVGVTKAPFVHFSISKAELRGHLSDIIVIFNR